MPEQTYAVTDATGALVSTGTVVADPLPDGLSARPLTDAEVAAMQAGAVWDTDAQTFGASPYVPPFPPLDATGALATLLVVEGVVGLQDAANAIHEEPAHLEHEAQAWGVG